MLHCCEQKTQRGARVDNIIKQFTIGVYQHQKSKNFPISQIVQYFQT